MQSLVCTNISRLCIKYYVILVIPSCVAIFPNVSVQNRRKVSLLLLLLLFGLFYPYQFFKIMYLALLSLNLFAIKISECVTSSLDTPYSLLY